MQLLVCLSPSWQVDVLVDQKAWVLVYADFFLWNINVDCLFVLSLHGSSMNILQNILFCVPQKKRKQ